ncbi:Alpha-ketoglutarate-dependent dioxygenase alkB 6 [Ranunculus cassubicifolius]
MDKEKRNLEDFKVGSLPTLFYIPNFVTVSEQTQILNNIYDSPISKWKSLKNRRLQNWGGIVHEKGLLPQALPPWLTRITHRICENTGLFPSAINHVLINEYLPDQGIMPHQDGPAYFPVVAILSLGCPAVMNFTPHLKLRDCGDGDKNSNVDANSNEHQNDYASSILLMPCSLLIFKDEAYSDYLHGIEDTNVHRLDKIVNVFESAQLKSNEDAKVKHFEQTESIERSSTRVSLTCRLVLKVHNKLFKF